MSTCSPGRKHRAPSPYKKKAKKPISYSTTPLNKQGEGIAASAENIAAFNRRVLNADVA